MVALNTSDKYRAEITASIKPAAYCSLAAGILFLFLVFIKDGVQIEYKLLEATSILISTLFIFLIGLIGGITYFYKITISKDGLSSYNPWETFKCYHMKWSDMEHIKIRYVFGYKYYYIWSSRLQEDLWVPYHIKNKKQFYNKLLKVAGEENILIKTIN